MKLTIKQLKQLIKEQVEETSPNPHGFTREDREGHGDIPSNWSGVKAKDLVDALCLWSKRMAIGGASPEGRRKYEKLKQEIVRRIGNK